MPLAQLLPMDYISLWRVTSGGVAMYRSVVMVCEDYDGEALVTINGALVTVNPVLPPYHSVEEWREAVENTLRAMFNNDNLLFCWATREEWDRFYQGVDIEASRNSHGGIDA